MECPFAEVGCTFTKISTSSAYQSHLSQNTEQHLQMVMKFHKTMLGSTSSNTLTEEGVVSPLQKLDAVSKEVEFLDGVLESYDMGIFPALECIKTHLKLPDLWIKSLGDKLAFRLTNFSQIQRKRGKWLSPTFFVKGGHKMCLCVHPNGTGSGYGAHMSVSLLLLFDDQLEWPVSLPPRTGIRVELLVEVEDESEDDTNKSKTEDADIELTWKPTKDDPASSFKRLPSLKKQGTVRESFLSSKEPLVKQSSYLPPWCQPSEDLKKTSGKYRSSDVSMKQKGADSLKEEEQAEGVTLIMSEKFASLSLVDCYAREYNSLVFQVALCLV